MGTRGRSKRTESGTSVTEPEDVESTSSRPRRSRLPKRYFDDDYSPPPAKRRAQRETPSENGDEEEKPTPPVSTKSTTRSTRSTPRGRPRKAATPPTTRRKSLKKMQEEVIYMDEDSDDAEESSDDEFIVRDEQEDIDEELNLNDIKVEKDDEKDNYCPWLDADPDSLPKLEIPESSQDIPLPNHATFDAIEVYEILRSYHRTLRLTPFTFEDFCAALLSKSNSCIIAEIHICLLRILMKSDDEEQTQYSVTDTNQAVNIMIHHLDALTYAEIVRQYIEAYPYADNSVREAINVENYPYVGYEHKLVVLLFMCYRFLYSSEYKKVVVNIGKFQNDENCRVCGKSAGKVIGCTQCEAAFHVECSHLKPFPEVLVCNICKRNNVRGVFGETMPFGEFVDREPLRSQPIGRDRYGRYYWFVARRLVVQSLDETEVHYYSTPLQLYQLLQKLDRNYYEKALCDTIRERVDEFLEQMTLTVELTAERRDFALDIIMKRTGTAYEYADSQTVPIYIHKDSMKRMASILRDCAEKVKVKEEVKNEVPEVEDDEATRSSGPLESTKTYAEDCILPETMLGIYDGRLINTFWSGGASQEELVDYYLKHMADTISPIVLWRMGDPLMDTSFTQYYNFYSRNEMSESVAVRKKTADKKKYMASKFLNLEEFIWTLAKDRQFYGDCNLQSTIVASTLAKITRSIPVELMHRRWPEAAKSFEIEISSAYDFRKLSVCLLKLDAVARKTIFIPQWWNGLGQTKMQRFTIEQRENFVKEQQRIKKMEADAMAKDLDDSYTRVNYMKPKWPNMSIIRQRGETYRNATRGAMGGWAWVAKKYIEKWIPVPESPTLPLAETESEIKKESKSNRKARRLELLVSKIKKRQGKPVKSEYSDPNFDLINLCYSPRCPSRRTSTTYPNPSCYSSLCRYGYLAKAKQRKEEERAAKSAVLGEDKPWPIPEIQTFQTKRGGKSIFVLQKNSRVLRQMIVTAGCQQVYMPGFNTGVKSNLLIWPYPAPRPTLDLCWKWQTLNARNLHAVALQLKIMWSSIKWNEFDPDDTHPDRRVVIDTPTHDERRQIIRHKEMPPYGQYERYQMEIEIIPLYDEQEEEDESWTSRRDRSADCSQRTSSNRKKRAGLRGLDNRQVKAIRTEWVDGITLKVYEIRDYWKRVRAELERAQKRKLELARKAARAREDEERKRQLALQRPPPAPIIPRMASTDRLSNVPFMAFPRKPADSNGNGRYLEKYNTSQIPPRTTAATVIPQVFASSSPAKPIVRHVAPNPIIHKIPFSSMQQHSPQIFNQHYPSTSRAAAGSDSTTYRAVVMNPNQLRGSPQQFRHQPMRYTTNGYEFPEGVLRGGGRATVSIQPRPRQQQQVNLMQMPFGETTTEMRRAMPVAEEAVAANAVGSDIDEQPPVIPRYDHNSPDPQNQQQRQGRIYTNGVQHLIRQIPSSSAGPPVAKNVVYLKHTDGNTQKMLIRPAGTGSPMDPQQQQQVYRAAQDYPPGTVITGGTRLVAVRSGQPVQHSQVRQVYTASAGPRFARVPNSAGTPRPSEQIVRRVIQGGQQRQVEYVDNHIPQQPMRYVLQSGGPIPAKMSRVVPRGGMTMQMVQQQQNPDHRRMLAGRQKQKVTTYRDFMASRGYLDASKLMMQTKPAFLPFEFNEEEEREINEAIAREEEWMRLEEEKQNDASGNTIRLLNPIIETHRNPPYVSNLLPSVNDSADDKVIKQVLDVMFSQVCRWDRQYGWAKTHMKRAKQKNDSEKLHLRKFRTNQRELLISEHMERLKKEINKRRTKMENEAEQQCGMLTPWRKSRSRPHRSAKPKAEVKKEVINPADITLGGDTYDYAKNEQKPTESIASGVARRRRTSANLSKSEDDHDVSKPDSSSKPVQTTRGNKERRISEPSRVTFYVPGATIVVDAGIPLCICQKIFDASRFYVQCDMCSRWYHGDCVDLTERKVQNMEHWTCMQCIEEQERVKNQPSLYCVCRKPYDDTKFYVGCDSCQGWFHPECVGTTRELAEQAAEYNCPECIRQGYESGDSEASGSSRISVQLSRADYTYVLELLELLVEHRMSTPFRKPVDLSEFKDYEQHIKKPMDLSTISRKVECTEYLYLSQFVNDVNLMFENAKTYNPPDHAVFKCAETMQEVFDKKLNDVREKMMIRQQELLLQRNHGDLMSARKRVQSESQKTVDSLDIDSDQLLPLDDKLMGLLNF